MFNLLQIPTNALANNWENGNNYHKNRAGSYLK